jgi:hypothetical protein
MTLTEMVEQNMDKAQSLIEVSEKRNRWAASAIPKTCMASLMYLARDMSNYHTGDTITIDGRHRASIS